MDFRAPVTPRHRLPGEVWPSRRGDKSITFCVPGRQDGTLCLAGTFTCVFIIADRFINQSTPRGIRDAIVRLVRAA